MWGKGGVAPGGSDMDVLLAAWVDYRDRPREERTLTEMSADLVELARFRDLVDLEFSQQAAGLAATEYYDYHGSVSPIDCIRHECKMSSHAAAERVCVGEELARLGGSVAALEEGEIGFGHLALMARTSAAVTRSRSSRGFDEGPLLAEARETSVGKFRYVCLHARHADDPDGCAADEKAMVERRELVITPCDDGAVLLSGLLDSVGGASLLTALDPMSRRTGADDDRSLERRRADALVELSMHCLDAGVLPQRATQRTHLQLTATVETALGMPGAPAADLEFSLPVSARVVERLACDSTVTRIVFGADSAIIDVGRARRVVSGATRSALNARDKCCRWPACDRSASWTAAHHLRHWTRGGPTNMDNLILLCHRHHWMVHEGRWQIVRTDDDRVLTVPPRTQSLRPGWGRNEPKIVATYDELRVAGSPVPWLDHQFLASGGP